MSETTTRRPAIPCKICREGSGRHPVYSSYEDRIDGMPEGYLCNTCADNAPASMVEITPDGQEVKPTGFSHIDNLMRRGREREREMLRPRFSECDSPFPQMPESPLNHVVLGVSVGRLLQILGVDLLRVNQVSVGVDVSHATEEVTVYWQMNGNSHRHLFTFEFLQSQAETAPNAEATIHFRIPPDDWGREVYRAGLRMVHGDQCVARFDDLVRRGVPMSDAYHRLAIEPLEPMAFGISVSHIFRRLDVNVNDVQMDTVRVEEMIDGDNYFAIHYRRLSDDCLIVIPVPFSLLESFR